MAKTKVRKYTRHSKKGKKVKVSKHRRKTKGRKKIARKRISFFRETAEPGEKTIFDFPSDEDIRQLQKEERALEEGFEFGMAFSPEEEKALDIRLEMLEEAKLNLPGFVDPEDIEETIKRIERGEF